MWQCIFYSFRSKIIVNYTKQFFFKYIINKVNINLADN